MYFHLTFLMVSHPTLLSQYKGELTVGISEVEATVSGTEVKVRMMDALSVCVCVCVCVCVF